MTPMKPVLVVLMLAGAGSAPAAEIVRWVDAAGMTHFSAPALAQAPATPVKLHAANGMDVPDASSIEPGQQGPVFRKISKPGKKNKDGWTGYQKQHRKTNRRRYR